MEELVIPPPARRDKNATEMIRAWVAENGLHCSLNIGMWEGHAKIREGEAWGILLADVIKHIANAMHERYDAEPDKTKVQIVKALFAELEIPTSEAKGQFWDH